MDSPRPATVLLVEDEEIVRKLVTTMLERAGYRVLVAESPDEALARAELEEHIDVLLTDVELPGVSGPELARRLSDGRPGLRVLFVSGYTSEAIERRPGTAFLQKPFTRAELTDAVEQLQNEPMID